MKHVKGIVLALCIMFAGIPSSVYADDVESMALLATPRYVYELNTIIGNWQGVGLVGESGSGYFLIPNVPYYLKLDVALWKFNSVTTVHNIEISLINSSNETVKTMFFKDYINNTPIEFMVPERGLYRLEIWNYGFDDIIVYQAELY